jgi:predicted transcriptional regulator
LSSRSSRDGGGGGFMQYRDRTKIISQILEVANGISSTRTKIMYKAYLSYNQLKEYLTILTENDLLSYDAYTNTFKATEKGLRFLDICNQMDGMIDAAYLKPKKIL